MDACPNLGLTLKEIRNERPTPGNSATDNRCRSTQAESEYVCFPVRRRGSKLHRRCHARQVAARNESNGGKRRALFHQHRRRFKFQVTDDAVSLLANTAEFDSWLNKLVPLTPEFDLFISYATADADVAGELRDQLVARGLKCFMAEKDVNLAENWQEPIRFALIGSKRVLILCTPESCKSSWLLMETGAAWALGKPLIPLLFGVDGAALIEPIRRHQARVIRTMGQREALVNELTATLS